MTVPQLKAILKRKKQNAIECKPYSTLNKSALLARVRALSAVPKPKKKPKKKKKKRPKGRKKFVKDTSIQDMADADARRDAIRDARSDRKSREAFESEGFGSGVSESIRNRLAGLVRKR